MKISIFCPDLAVVLARIAAALERIAANTKPEAEPSDMKIRVTTSPITSGENAMADFHCKMGPKTGAKKLVAPTPIQLKVPGPINIFLDPIDAQGNDVPVTNPANHQGTLTVDNPAAFVVSPGADTLHFTAVVPKGTPPSTSITLSATDHAADGSFPDLAAQQVVITPAAPLPSDLKINISFGP